MLAASAVHAATHEMKVAGADIQVDIDEDAFRSRTSPILQWITRSAQIVASSASDPTRPRASSPHARASRP